MPSVLRAPRAVLFDLDGTLVDSHAAIAASIDHMLDVAALPRPTREVREAALSFPLRVMVAKITGADTPEAVERHAQAYLEHYVATMVQTSIPFDGVTEMLDGLHALGLPLAVLTNKTEVNAIRIVEGRFGAARFRTTVGTVPGRASKPSPEGAEILARALGIALEDCWLIGDSELDIATARAAGMVAIGVTWGITPTLAEKIADADRLLHTPAALTALVTEALGG